MIEFSQVGNIDMSKTSDFITKDILTRNKKGFTGYVKYGFEAGKLQSINEGNRTEILTTVWSKNFNLFNFVSGACESNFYGSIVLVFAAGELIEYGYIRSFKGEILRQYTGDMGYADL